MWAHFQSLCSDRSQAPALGHNEDKATRFIHLNPAFPAHPRCQLTRTGGFQPRTLWQRKPHHGFTPLQQGSCRDFKAQALTFHMQLRECRAHHLLNTHLSVSLNLQLSKTTQP